MKTMKNIWLIGLLLLASLSYAQKGKLKEADEKFTNLAFVDALEIYEKVVAKGYENQDLLKKLGDAYYFNAQYVKAGKWYKELFELNPEMPAVYNFRYGQTLKAQGDYDNADIWLQKFYDSQGIIYEKSSVYLDKIAEISNRYIVDTVSFNSAYSDYPAFIKRDVLYVVSGSKGGKKTPWNDEPTSDIFILKNSKLKRIQGDVNTKFNEGSLVITKDGKTMYFTRNDFKKGKRGRDRNNVTRLKLYRAQLEYNEWKKVEELPFNSSEYSIGHPALSMDERTLYFVSDMKDNGSKGGTDIYQIPINDDGSFGALSNMAVFNTPENEMFPFVTSSGLFYFASNGQITNLGGLDIFVSEPNSQGEYKTLSNVGRPINSPMDDFAFVLNATKEEGYLSSNRKGSEGDDIYSVAINENYEEPCYFDYVGIVKDKNTGYNIENVVVSLIDANNKVIHQKTSINGTYRFNGVDCDKVKFVRAEKNNYQTREKLVLVAKIKDRISNTTLLLDRRRIYLTEGSDVGLIINPIYFNLNKDFIRHDAEIELQKIIAILKINPMLKLNIKSHTDSRANDQYNLRLSNRRAQATINYIVSAGIDASRLTGKGYGETQLINKCKNGVNCSDSQHQVNRRSEFIVFY